MASKTVRITLVAKPAGVPRVPNSLLIALPMSDAFQTSAVPIAAEANPRKVKA